MFHSKMPSTKKLIEELEEIFDFDEGKALTRKVKEIESKLKDIISPTKMLMQLTARAKRSASGTDAKNEKGADPSKDLEKLISQIEVAVQLAHSLGPKVGKVTI